MEVKARLVLNATILDLIGELTYANRTTFKAAVERAKQGGCRHLVLNMERVRFLDSSALGMLALLAQSFKVSQGRVSLLKPQSYVREIMTLANIHKMMPLYESEEEALASHSVPATC